MVEEKFLSEFDISRELHTGIAVTRFLLNRFQQFLQPDTSSGRPQYPYKSIGTLIKIKQAVEKGQPLDQIEQTITSLISRQDSADSWSPPADHGSTPESGWLQELLKDLSDKQQRLAIAQEKRVQAEERKAAAIEKRAKAEEQKAIAMGQIASALKELTSLRSAPPDPYISQIASQTAQIFPMEEDLDMDTDAKDFLSNPLEEMIPSSDPEEQRESEPEKDHAHPKELQDLSLLLDEAFPEIPLPTTKHITDVSQELDDDDDFTHLSDLDDLSDLMESISEEEPEITPAKNPIGSDEDVALDTFEDLMGDIPEEANNSLLDLDDLSSLIEEDTPSPKSESVAESEFPDMDDLSALIQEDQTEPPSSIPMDDLSLLLEPEDISAAPINPLPMDDLSQLLDNPVSLKPSITPEQDLEAYKTAIIDMIITQKTDGIPPEQTAKRMNQDGVRTLSGKPQWSVKAVEQIYQFIDAAASQ